MANDGKNLIVKNWTPRILLRSIKDALSLYLGTNGSQFTLNSVAFSNIKTVKKIIGAPGVAGCDFNWTSAANVTAQNLDLGSIIPAFARVLEVRARVTATHTGGVSLAITAGNASAGAQFLASVQAFTLDVVVGTLLALLWTVAPTAAASKIWLQGVPGANWSLMTVGKMEVNITYIEVA